MATIQTERTASPDRPRRRFTVEEYHRMLEAGILDEGDRVELIGGEVLWMTAMGARHARTLAYLDDELRSPLAGRAQLRVQLPITISEYDEPEPDLAAVRPREDRYLLRHPGPEDVQLVVEISDNTLQSDLRDKLPVYARAGIPEVWIVNLRGYQIEQHSHPDRESGAYTTVVRYGPGETVTSSVLPGLAVPVDPVLGPRPG